MPLTNVRLQYKGGKIMPSKFTPEEKQKIREETRKAIVEGNKDSF